MKVIMFFAALMILISGFAFGQSQDTSDAQQNRQRTQQKKMDKFIDRDGDGICDQREQGLGFKRGKHREEKQREKNQTPQVGKSGTTGTVQPSGSGTGNQYRGRRR